MINTDKHLCIKYITGFILITIACFLFIYYSYKNIENISLPFLNGIYDEIDINIEIPQKLQNEIIINNGLSNFKLKSASVNHNKNGIKNFYTSFTQKSKFITITLPVEYENTFFNSVITANVVMGKSFFDFTNNEIRNFKKDYLNNNGTQFVKIYFPNNVTKIKNSRYINYKGNLNLLVITFLSFFYCLKIYALP